MRALFLFIVLIIPAFSSAMDFNIYGGFGSTRFTGNGNWAREFGFEGGLLYMRPIAGNWVLRTGLGVAQKNSKVDLPGNLTESVDYVLLELPFTALYQMTSFLQPFGGINFGYVIDDSNVVGAKDYVFNLPVGLRILLPEEQAIEAYYEWGITDLASANGSHFRIGTSICFRYLASFSF